MSLNFLKRKLYWQPQPPEPILCQYTAPSGAVYWAHLLNVAPDQDANWVEIIVWYSYDQTTDTWKSMPKTTVFEALSVAPK